MKKTVLTIITVSLLLVSLTTLFEAKQILVWKISILATEYGHWLAAMCVVLAVVSMFRFQTLVLLFSAVLFLRPAFSAYENQKRWANDLHATFSAANDGPLLSARKLWSVGGGTPVYPQRLVYTDHPEQLVIDFYRTECKDPAPWILVVHGGGWDSGDQTQFAAFNSHLAFQGYSVAAITYRLAPKWKWPAQRDDVATAVSYLKAHAKELNIDPDQWAMIGRSAGGQIAEAAAYQTPNPGLKGLIAFYSPADLNFAYRYAEDNDIINSRDLLVNYVGGKPSDVPAKYKDASPIEFTKKNSTPTLLLHGARDPLTWVAQSRRLCNRLKETGARAVYIELPWATHAFDFNMNGPGGQIAANAVDRFLAATFTKRSHV